MEIISLRKKKKEKINKKKKKKKKTKNNLFFRQFLRVRPDWNQQEMVHLIGMKQKIFQKISVM